MSMHSLLTLPHLAPLPFPTAVSVAVVGSSLRVSWTNADATATTRIYRDGVSIGTVAAGVTQFTNSGVTPATLYLYQVRHEKSGRVPSPRTATVNGTLGVVPPTGLVYAFNVDDVVLDWTITVPSAQTRIYRDGVLVGTVGAGVSSFADADVPNGDYVYDVRHWDGTNLSGPSNTVDVTMAYFPPINAPTGLSHTTPFTDRASLSWTNTESVETRIYRGGVLITTVAAGVTTYNDDSVSPGSTYNYTVRHWNGGVESLDSNTTSPTMPTASWSMIPEVTLNEALDQVVLTFGGAAVPRGVTYGLVDWSDSEGHSSGGPVYPITSPYAITPGDDILPPGDPGIVDYATLSYGNLQMFDSAMNVVQVFSSIIGSYPIGAA